MRAKMRFINCLKALVYYLIIIFHILKKFKNRSSIMSKNKQADSNNLPEVKIHEILENTPVGIITLDEKLNITSVNGSLLQFGFSEFSPTDKMVGKNINDFEVFSKDNLKQDINYLKEGIPFERELSSIKTLDGSDIIVLIKGSPIVEKSKFKGGIIVVEDFRVISDIQQDKIIRSGFFSKFLSSVFNYFLISDLDGNIQYTPSKIMFDVGNTIFENEHENLFEIFSEEYIADIKKTLAGVSTTQKSANLEIPIKYQNSTTVYKLGFAPIFETEQTSPFVFVLFSDITSEGHELADLKKEIKELGKYQAITSAIMDAVISINLDGRISFWNDSAAELFNLSRSEVYGQLIGKVLTSIDEDYFEKLKNELEKNNVWEGEIKYEPNEESSKLLLIRMAITDEKGEKSIVALCSDITERVRLESELRLSEERYRSIITNTHEYICTFSVEGNITYVNPYFVGEFGYTEDEFLNKSIENLIDIDLLQDDFPDIQKIIDEQTDVELPLIKKDNSRVYVIANFTNVTDLQDNTKYYTAIFTEITEKRNAERDLMMVRSVFEAAQEGIAVQNNRKYTLVNDSFARMFGYDSYKDILGKDPLDFVDDEEIAGVAKHIESREMGEDSPEKYHYKGKKKDGSQISIEKSVTSFETAEGLFVVSSFRDITHQKIAMTALEESEEKYRGLTENINDSVWTAERVDNKLKQIFYTSAVEKITGYPNKNFIDDPKLWLRIIHPNDRENMVTKLRRVFKDPVRNTEEFEYRVIHKLGNIVWIKNKLNLLRDEKGEIQKIYGLISDITLNKKSEEEVKKSTEELKVLNESKDRFISIVSHDLRTPFSSILGFTDLLLTDSNLKDDKQIEYVTYIQESARSMLSLVNSLLDWTRLQTGRISFEPERINAGSIITKSIQMLSGAALQKNINLVSDIEEEVYVHADENLLLQVFNNIVSNAIKFTKDGGSIVISAMPLASKIEVQFKVKDSGIGIKEEDIQKLFSVDSKYTTEGTSGEKGSGLGLSLCKEIVLKHGGEISVNSEYGKGTEFLFTIPISSMKILLVDDTATDRILYSKLLKSIIPDYKIEEASNGEEAFDIIKYGAPALVITDHDMPKMSGYELVQTVRKSELKFKPPIMILSSDINDSIIEEYHELGVEYAFNKPVDLTIFKFAIEKSLKKALIS